MQTFMDFMRANWGWILSFGTVLVGVLTYVYVHVKALQLGLQALLRAQMIQYYNTYTDKGYAPIYARESFENCWIQYEKLGKNGVMKDIRNNVNRANNCEAANLDKTISAAAEQCRAVRIIEENGGLQTLSPELYVLAKLRRDNPDLSLRELGELLEPPLSRAGVCHRFRRIRETADGILAKKSKK